MQFDRATAVVEAATPPLVRRRNKLLAPANWQPVDRFRRLQYSPLLHRHMTHSLQRFRGGIYVLDGALRSSDLTSDGRHEQSIDSESWHLLTLDEVGRVVTCARYYSAFQPSFDKTGAAASALAHCPKWKDKVRIGVRETMDEAKRRGMQFAELGGWCIGGALRNSPEALRTVLRMFALGELLGGTVGLSTATTRHSSASILQRLGATKLRAGDEELPSYFDPRFDCEMELLRFDSSRPIPRYSRQILEYQQELESEIEVICNLPTWQVNESLNHLHRSLAPQFADVPQIDQQVKGQREFASFRA